MEHHVFEWRELDLNATYCDRSILFQLEQSGLSLHGAFIHKDEPPNNASVLMFHASLRWAPIAMSQSGHTLWEGPEAG